MINYTDDFPLVAVLDEGEHIGKSLLPIIDMMLRWGEEHFDIFEKKYLR